MAWSSRACHQARQSSFPLVVAFGASGALEGCASDPVIDGSEQVGSLGVRLEVAPGVTLNSVTYSITGNGFSKTGTIDTSGAPAISATIGGIPRATATPSR